MRLRRLEIKDAQFMLEWMHDKTVTEFMRNDFQRKNILDAEEFIKSSWDDKKNIHLAIVTEEDDYMGTVSLKDIENKTAEFAITVRTCAMGKGYSWIGMKSILQKAFYDYGIECVYWSVNRANKRAMRFYDKHNFNETIDIPKQVMDKYNGISGLKWYSVLKGDLLEVKSKVAGCDIIKIDTIPTINEGQLSFFEGSKLGDKTLPFEVKRIYYISKVPEGVRRGFHAHKKLKQLLFCPYGKIQLLLENKHGREEIELSDPSIGVLIDIPTWREMLWLQKDSVLCVAASDYYDKDDYIRDYSEFMKFEAQNN